MKVTDIINQFDLKGRITRIIPWGNGLINDTYRICTDSDTDYLLQRMNEANYGDIASLVRNIDLITDMINRRSFHFAANGREKQLLRVIRLKNGELMLRDELGQGWRVYNFIDNSYSIERGEKAEEVYKVGLVLGQFHYLLKDFPVEKLTVIVPDFHNPMAYYHKLKAAIAEDRMGRAAEVAAEIAFIEERVEEFDFFNQALRENRIPLRVNHNDPKINNVMFDMDTDEPICMVDMDTVMPGVLPYDFGDAVRSGMCTGKDKGPDMDYSNVLFDMELYANYYRGFLQGTKGDGDESMMTPEEIRCLSMGVRQIVLESSMRYLTDYLQGDVYFKVKYPEQNLVKTRMHQHLAADMESKKWEIMNLINGTQQAEYDITKEELADFRP